MVVYWGYVTFFLIKDPPSMKNSKKYPYWCVKLFLRYQPEPAQCEVLCISIHCAVVLHSDGFLEHCGCLERAVKKTIKAESRTSALREGDKVYIRSHRRNDPLQMVPARFCPIEEIKFRHFDWRTKKRYQDWASKESWIIDWRARSNSDSKKHIARM